MQHVLCHEFVLVLLEDKVNDWTDLSFLEELIVSCNEKVQIFKAKFCVEIKN